MAPRTPQKLGTKGSLAWMQALVNRHPAHLNSAVGAALGVEAASIEWVSPLAADDHAEYRDHGFLEKLGISLGQHSLPAFWPSGGPQWDALGRTRDGVILVEAKAHLNELASTCAAGSRSMARIQEGLLLVKRGIGAREDSDWTTPYYQYANRLAHLYLLRELNGIDASLVLLCFLNDHEMRGPATAEEWLRAFDEVHRRLAIPQHAIFDHVHHVFVDVDRLRTGSVLVAA